MASASTAPAIPDRPFVDDPARSYTLPARYYWDPEVYAREMDAIFGHGWVCLGHGEALTDVGDYTTFVVGDQNVFVVRGKDGVLRGFHNVCSHRAHELLSGAGRTTVITCPYHAWSYHIDGALRTARGSEKVAGFNKDEFCLKPVRVEEFCGFIFVNLDNNAAPLADQSGGLEADIRGFAPDLDQLTHAHRLTFDIKANWKIVIDNFLECYHCPVAHPAFVGLIDVDSYRIVNHGIYSTHHARAGGRANKAYSTVGAEVADHAVWWLWPNTCILRFPGSANIMTMRMIPTGPEGIQWIIDFYFLDSTPDAAQAEAIAYVKDVLTPEDVSIVESVQRGLHSRGYNQGRFIVDEERSGQSEHGVHYFHSLVFKALED